MTTVATGSAARLPLKLPELEVVGSHPRFGGASGDKVVITHRQIAASGASNLGDLLEGQPGISLVRYGAAGSLVTASLRGSTGEGILILRDGVRLNDPQTGTTDLFGVSLLGVDHVEIREGGASARYGQDAIGGVINLVSGPPHPSLSLGLGSYGAERLQVEIGHGEGDDREEAAIEAEAATNAFPEIYRGAQELRANAQYHEAGAWLSRTLPVASGSLTAQFLYGSDQRGVPGPINQPSPEAQQRDESLLGSVVFAPLAGAIIQPVLSLSHRHATLDYDDPQAAYGPPETLGTVESTQFHATAGYDRGAHDASVGLGLTREADTASGFGFRSDYDGSVFGTDSYRLGHTVLSGGLRADDDTRWGASLNPHVGVSHVFFSWLRLRGQAGHSFHPPSFNDLYWPKSADAAGNPDLHPEQATTGDVGLDAADRSGDRAALTAFVAAGQGTIVWAPGAGGQWSPSNVGQTWTQGLEGHVSASLPASTSISLHGTWQAVTDVTPGDSSKGMILPYQPSLLAGATAGWQPLRQVQGTITLDYTGQRPDTAANTEYLPAFSLLSARVAYAPTSSDTLAIEGQNLLNTYYVLEPYYPMPGLTIWTTWTRRL